MIYSHHFCDASNLASDEPNELLDAALFKIGTGLLNQDSVIGKIAGQIPYLTIARLHRYKLRSSAIAPKCLRGAEFSR